MTRGRDVEMRERHRFQLPWSVEEQEACFLVRDHSGQALAYVYFDKSRHGGAANAMIFCLLPSQCIF
jgi:hypothetical protein